MDSTSDEPIKTVDLDELGKIVLPDNIDTVFKKYKRKKNDDDAIAKMIHEKRRKLPTRPGYKDTYKYSKKNTKWRIPQKRN